MNNPTSQEPTLPTELDKLIEDYKKAHESWLKEGTAAEQYSKQLHDSFVQLVSAAQRVNLLWGLDVRLDIHGAKITFEQDKPKGTYVD